MHKARYFIFKPFRLDVLDERLWEYEKSVRLGHKALAVLECLVSQAGQLVTKDDLLATAWPDTSVSEAVLTTAMREIRRALKDQARVPQFIETVHGRGYRFIAPVSESSLPALPATPANEQSLSPFHLSRLASSYNLVGREAEWTQLHEWYAAAQQGTHRIGFVAGEAGIGKTVLVEAFVSEVLAQGKARVSRGQCIQQFGAGEAYLPILESLGRLARDDSIPIADILRKYAPSWLVHLPSLATGEELEATTPVTSEKMLRELADAIEILTAQDAMILVLEDLHWSDTSTIELLAYLARRRDPARLLILGTYRPIEVILHKHPLRNLMAELRLHPQCPELVLDYLSSKSVQDYILLRCGQTPRLKEDAEVLHRRTGGHPLFFTTIVDELMRRRIMEDPDAPGLVGTDLHAIANVIPTSVRQFIEHRFEQLSSEEQTILEAASAAGNPFSVAAVVAATSLAEDKIDQHCASWAREAQFLIADGTVPWPDGTLATRYSFRHDLFQEVVYARISPKRRARFHQQIGLRLETAYAKRWATIAAELAVHFAEGRDPRKAVSYLEQAARNALQRSAYSEAGRHLRRAQEMIEALPEGRERLSSELELSLLLGHVMNTTRGWGLEEVERVYRRACVLCEEIEDSTRLPEALWGLISVGYVRSEFRKTQSLAREVLELAEKRRDSVFRILGHMELGGNAFTLGDLTSAAVHFQEADRLYNPGQHRSHLTAFGADMGLFSRSWETHYLWQAGYPDRALAKSEETLKLASELSHPFTKAITLAYATMLNQFSRTVRKVDRLAEATIAHTTEHGFPYYLAWAEVLRGWSRAAQGASEDGIAEIRGGIETLQRTAGVRLPYYRFLLAEACGWSGRIDEALLALADAFAEVANTEERWWEPELHRLRGELLRSKAKDKEVEAESCFLKGIEIARAQMAKSLELRAAMSLARLWRDTGKRTQARRLLAEVYPWFTEGFETPDLKDARSLLNDNP